MDDISRWQQTGRVCVCRSTCLQTWALNVLICQIRLSQSEVSTNLGATSLSLRYPSREAALLERESWWTAWLLPLDWTTSFLPRSPFPQVLPSWCMSMSWGTDSGSLFLLDFSNRQLPAKISQQSSSFLQSLPLMSSFSAADLQHTLPTFSFSSFIHRPFPHKCLHFILFWHLCSGWIWTDTRLPWGLKIKGK